MAEEKVTKEQVEEEANKYADNVSAEDVDEILGKEEKINLLFKTVKKLSKYAGDIMTVFSLLKDYVTGKYKNCPWRTIAALVGMLIYVLSPLDLIPDFLPVAGWLDDSAMIAFVLAIAQDDLNAYKEWKAIQEATICVQAH